MKEIVDYIISFLLYGNSEAANLIGYTDQESQWKNYPIVIIPNGHLGKDIIMPNMEHPAIETIPLQENKNRYVIHTDIIYNTFFFISRAEELINPQRDQHGRFLAEYSILGKENRLMIPIIDEYSRMLLKLLELPLPTPSFSRIFLTHDVDSIAHYRHLRGALGGIARGRLKDTLASRKDIHNDPAFTFSWLIHQDKQVDNAECIYFIKDTAGKGYDYPQYNLKGKDFHTVQELIENSGAKIGLHSSYYGKSSTFAKVFGYMEATYHMLPKTLYHRSHYLRCSTDDMQQWNDLGITDDFTIAFPDQVGFRLQTTRSVRWINPKTMQLTNLVLHPLTVMDCTLSNDNYMNLNEDEAYFECQRLFEKVYQNAGEITLLWHNTIINNTTYHKSLYPKVLSLLNK